jgi:hypothetical protein
MMNSLQTISRYIKPAPQKCFLLELPPELLDMIVEETLPEGFEGIALSCKALYEVAKRYIENHRYMKYVGKLQI